MTSEIEYFVKFYNINPAKLEEKFKSIIKNIDDVETQKIALQKAIKIERNEVALRFYEKIKDTIQTGTIVQNINDSNYHLKLKNWPEELILPAHEAIKGDVFKHNDQVLVYIIHFKNNVKTVGQIIC